MSVSAANAALTLGAKATLIKMEEGRSDTLTSILCDVETSTSRTNHLPWVGESPRLTLHDVNEALKVEKVKDIAYSVDNENYRAGISISVDDLSDDQVGGFATRINGMIKVGEQLPDRLLFTALESTTLVGYDTVSYFNNAHPDRGGGQQDNLLAGTGTTQATVAADFDTGLETLASFLGENSEPLNDNPTEILIVAPHAIRKPIKESIIGGGDISNAQMDGVTVRTHFSGRLTDTNDWYMFDLSGATKPFVLFEREKLNHTSTDESSDEFNLHDRFTHRVKWRGKVALGHWGRGVKFVNS